MKKKVYLAWFPEDKKKAKFFNNWEDCKNHVHGVSGIKYKGFSDKESAQDFLNDNSPSLLSPETLEKKNSKLEVYVDGSYQPDCPFAGWAWVAVQNNQAIKEDYGITNQPAQSNNIDGEIEATLMASQWIKDYLSTQKYSSENEEKIVIHYDCEGIASWALGKWKTKIPLTADYQKQILPYLKYIDFKKVRSHTGNKWNDFVDKLAKKAIQEFLKQN